MAYIELKNLHFQYEYGEEEVLKNLNLSINKGEYVVITGKTSAGKSTLSFCLNGLIPHSVDGKLRGDIAIDDLDVKKSRLGDISRKVGIVFQNPESQIYGLSVEEDVLFALENFGFDNATIKKRIEWALHAVDMEPYIHRSPFDLSGGQKQRVIIASVLALQPDIIVLDEPTAEIDPQGKSDILRILRILNEEHGITIVLVEHEMERVVEYADRILVMDQGSIELSGTPKSVFQNIRKLESLGVKIPPVCRLFNTLKEKGYYEGEIPVSIKDAQERLEALIDD